MPIGPQSPHPHALGFVARPAAKTYAINQGRWCQLRPFDVATLPKAYSLTRYRKQSLRQQNAGTCWVHAAVQHANISELALGYDGFLGCRRLAGYEGKQIEGGGNPSDGGDPTDALMTMIAGKGPGIAHETLCPYSDDYTILGTEPPDTVYEDATHTHIVSIVEVRSDDESMQMIFRGHPVANGIWWPYGWDDRTTFHAEIGSGQYGHALLECGYAMPGVFDEYGWLQLDNWHDPDDTTGLYPALPPELAAKVAGYRPSKGEWTSDFWVRLDVLEAVRQMGNAIRVSTTDMEGVRHQVVTEPGFLQWIGPPGAGWTK